MLLYPTKLSFRTERQNKKKLKEFITTKPVLKEVVFYVIFCLLIFQIKPTTTTSTTRRKAANQDLVRKYDLFLSCFKVKELRKKY